ncbi:GDSL-type esterase/lipase family protein [Frankia sp. AgKG'84/4]|uniref:GDSL-type esterase/lipase family protein n=1 Tax=Frankia sp. AgKG'84/4 TaxID=573490 RepID=UPI00200D8B01|nr:GDSL-type esterase/lipase family protein [Frankia sp. AgKG'84/4]MCL9793385.1 GDSL-type esterase/lipase family protein [Frankia sp. AgKG'84/4]
MTMNHGDTSPTTGAVPSARSSVPSGHGPLAGATDPTDPPEQFAPTDSRLAWEGAVEVTGEAPWWQFWRLPPRGLAVSPAAPLAGLASVPAGVRAAIRTDARVIGLSVLAADQDAGVLDVVVDGELAGRHRVAGEHPGPVQIEVELPGRLAVVEIWLPHRGVVLVGAIRLFGHTTVRPSPHAGPRWVVYGSSITQSLFAAGPSETWTALAARALGWRLHNLGFAAQAYLDPTVARGIRALPADIITLELGINVYLRAGFSPRTWAPAVQGFVETIREGHPRTPVVVVSPLVAPGREDRPNAVGATLAEIRDGVVAAVDALRELGDPDLHLIDGRSLVGSADRAVLLDDLHPSPVGEELIAQRVSVMLRALGHGARES